MLRVLLYRAWVLPDKCTVAAFFQRVHNISFFWRANSTQHILSTWKTVRYRELRPQHMWPSQPLSLFPHPNVTLAKVEWNFKKRSTTGNSPRDVHLSKRCEACKKLTQVLCKKTKNPQKNLTVRPENGERFLQLTKETWSLEEKNKAVTVPKKEQTTKQFLLVHTCKPQSARYIHRLPTSQFHHHGWLQMHRVASIAKKMPQNHAVSTMDGFATNHFFCVCGVGKCKT